MARAVQADQDLLWRLALTPPRQSDFDAIRGAFRRTMLIRFRKPTPADRYLIDLVVTMALPSLLTFRHSMIDGAPAYSSEPTFDWQAASVAERQILQILGDLMDTNSYQLEAVLVNTGICYYVIKDLWKRYGDVPEDLSAAVDHLVSRLMNKLQE